MQTHEGVRGHMGREYNITSCYPVCCMYNTPIRTMKWYQARRDASLF